MAQIIKIKRGGISGLPGLSTQQGELIIATGSLGNNVNGPFLLTHGDNLGLTAGAVFTGSSAPTITDSKLNGILFYNDTDNKFYRLDSNGNQVLEIEAFAFGGTTDDITEGSTNFYYSDSLVKTKLNIEDVVSGSATQVRTFLNVEDGADVTDATNVEAAGALMDSEVDADIKTLSLPANTTISTFGASLVDDVDVSAARTTLGVDAAGTDNSTNVTLAGSYDYLTLSGQQITLNQIDYTTDILNTPSIPNAPAIENNSGTPVFASGITKAEVLSLINVEDGADVTDATNVEAAGALMDSELTDITAVKALNQGVTTTDTPQFAGLTVNGNLSVTGTLTTVNSNNVNIGDRIITLNTADGAGDAGIQVHDTNGTETGSLLWDTDGDYWKVGKVGGSDYRLVEWDGEIAGAGDFVVTDVNGRIDALATTTAGDMLISDGDGTFTVTNVIDGGTF